MKSHQYLLLLGSLILSLSTRAQETQLTAFDGDFADLFGFDVAIDGEYAVVGAPLQGGFGTMNAGAAYVFQNIGGVWTYVKKLVPPGGGMPGEQFGYSVAIDGNRIIVGAPGRDHYGLDDVGSAYVYSGSGTNWFPDGSLYPQDGAAQDRFGTIVDIHGHHAVIGVPNDDDHGTSSGSVYVFRYDHFNWLFADKLHASDASEGDAFGTGVAIDGATIVAGAPANVGVEWRHSGAIYVFEPYHYIWEQSQRLTHENAGFFDHLGQSVDIADDHIIAGAPFALDKAGIAIIYHQSGGYWTQSAEISAADGSPHDKFGMDVAIDPGIAAVGAPLDDDLGAESGSMYVFNGSIDAWAQMAKHTASDGMAHDKFGNSVDADPGVVFTGAQNQDVLNTDAGAAYIYMPAAFASHCPPVLNLSGVLYPGQYQSSDHVEVQGQVKMPGPVSIHSPNYVQVMQGFEVPQGAELIIDIQGCP